MRALFFGDSITDDSYTTATTTASGFYADMLCGQRGWTRVGQAAGDPNRAAISATLLEASPLVPEPENKDAAVTSFDRRVRAYAPEVLVVNYGTNDFYFMSQGLNLDTWAAAWNALFAEIATLGLLRPAIILGLMGTVGKGLPLPVWAYNAEWLRARLDAITRETADAHNCVFVPLYGVNGSHVRPDGHPSPRGHGFIAGEILAALGVA